MEKRNGRQILSKERENEANKVNTVVSPSFQESSTSFECQLVLHITLELIPSILLPRIQFCNFFQSCQNRHLHSLLGNNLRHVTKNYEENKMEIFCEMIFWAIVQQLPLYTRVNTLPCTNI